MATFKHHTDSITTVEWHPTDSTVFASGGSDNQIALWDLAVEKDAGAEQDEIEVITIAYKRVYVKTYIMLCLSGVSPSAALHTPRSN